MRHSVLIIAILFIANGCQRTELNREQRLIVACHRLDVDGVVIALRDGADANGRFGDGDSHLFKDPWTGGWPVAAARWTPLLAVAQASDYPDPPHDLSRGFGDLDWLREQRAKVPPQQIEERRRNASTIALILLSHRADIDADDGYGATALSTAVYLKKLELAKLLLRFNAKVNTKTGVYIDGPGGITPLHHAYWSAELTKLLLEKGADPNARDSDGRTPRDWASSSEDPSVKRLYKAP